MLPLLGSMISGGASLLGGLFSSNTAKDNTQANIAMQRETNQMSMEEAERNRGFQENMSSTAYQRAAQDMQAAGLNKSMMFGSGGAASAPAGNMASFGTAKSENVSPMANLGGAADKVVSSAVAMKTFEKMTDEIANLRATESKIKADTVYTGQRTETEKQETVKKGAESSLTQNLLPASRVSAREGEALGKLPAWVIDNLARIEYGSKKTHGVTDQLGDLLSSATGLKRLLKGTKSTSETSRQDSKGNWYDEFRENKSW